MPTWLQARLVDDRIQGYRWGLAQPNVDVLVELSTTADGPAPGAIDTALAELGLRVEPPSLRAPAGTPQAIVERWARSVIALQRQQRIPVSPHCAVYAVKAASDSPLRMHLALPVYKMAAARRAVDWAVDLFDSLHRRPDDRAGRRHMLQDAQAALRAMRPSAQNHFPIVDACFDLGIPVLDANSSATRLGVGASSIQLNSTITSRTSPIGLLTVRDKYLTSRRLREAGLPAPVNHLAGDAGKAVQLAASLGYPVVVKPNDQEQGKGVHADLVDETSVRLAFEGARRFSHQVIVEKHLPGEGHRLTVFEGRVLRVRRKRAAGVVGDGMQTVRDLLQQLNNERARLVDTDGLERAPVNLDEEAQRVLSQAGLSPADVPAPGQYVALRGRNNTTAGGTNETLPLDRVHSDNLDLAVRVARLFGLDLAGIDLITPDIGQSWLSVSAGICDVNAQPQIDPVTLKEILATLPVGAGEVPIHLLIVADTAPAEVAERAGELARRLGCEGIASRDGLVLRGRRISRPMASGLQAAQALMLCPDLHAGLCVLTVDEVLQGGLPLRSPSSIHIVPGSPSQGRPQRSLQTLLAMVRPHCADLHKATGTSGWAPT